MIVARSVVIAEAVTATTGIARVVGSARSRRSASMPSMPGRWMSMRTSAGRCSCVRRTPSSPVSASTTRYPRGQARRAPACGSCRCPRRGRSARRPWSRRQRECERRAVAELTLDPDAPAVQLDELAREGEAKPGALVLLGVVRPDLPELLEHDLDVFAGDADAGVGHRHFHLAVQALRADLDAPALGRELHRVRQEVEEDLLDLALVAAQRAQLAVEPRVEGEPLARGALADEHD